MPVEILSCRRGIRQRRFLPVVTSVVSYRVYRCKRGLKFTFEKAATPDLETLSGR